MSFWFLCWIKRSKMKKIFILSLVIISVYHLNAQRLLTSWSQNNIENYTKEMYDDAQKLNANNLLEKNLNVEYWSETFLVLNASINNYSKDNNYLIGLANQITNKKETKLKGTSRLIIWDRISNGDVIFEGKGLVFENDLYTVSGRANQILQSLTNKNFGFVTINSTERELETIKSNWLNYLQNKPVEEAKITENKNAKIPEISNFSAVQALILSLQENPAKTQITKKCLKNLYNLEDLPKEKGSPATYCNPDTYTNSYLGLLFGDKNYDETKDSKWWSDFWIKNKNQLFWNSEKGIFEVKK